MTHEGTKNIRTKFEEAINRIAIPYIEDTEIADCVNELESISDQQSIEAMKWATRQGWDYSPSKDMWLGREGGNGKVMALNDSELLDLFKSEQENN